MISKILVLLTSLQLSFSANAAGPAGLQETLQKDIQRLSANPEEASKAMIQSIEQKYGYEVECEDGYFDLGLWGQLDWDECYLGLIQLGAALPRVQTDLPKHFLESIEIELVPAGQWQGLTFDDREIGIPFTADPTSIATFLQREITTHFKTSLEDLVAANDAKRAEIEKNFNIQLITEDLNAYQIHDGLARLQTALQMVTVGTEPRREIREMGFDVIVLSESSASLTDDGKKLKLGIDIEDRPGKMFQRMIYAVKSPGGLSIPIFDGMNWQDVQRFRTNQKKIADLKEWFSTRLPGRQVDCLIKGETGFSRLYEVGLQKCREGMERLRHATNRMKSVPAGQNVGLVLIGNGIVSSYWMDDEKGAMVIDADANLDKMIQALNEI